MGCDAEQRRRRGGRYRIDRARSMRPGVIQPQGAMPRQELLSRFIDRRGAC
jgi:hypothetical protein